MWKKKPNLTHFDGTKLSGVDGTPEGRNAIQRELDSLEKCACENLMKFNKGK